jgi:hypothetical protein
LKLKNHRAAEEQFNAWSSLEDQIENGIVKFQAQMVKEELENRKRDFIVSASVLDLNIDRHKEDLRDFLIEKARRKYTTIKDMADALGVTRQTL